MENSRRDPARFDETMRLLRASGARLSPRAAVAIGDKQAVLQMHPERRLHNEIHTLRGGLLSIAVRVDRPEMVSSLLDLGPDGEGGYAMLDHLTTATEGPSGRPRTRRRPSDVDGPRIGRRDCHNFMSTLIFPLDAARSLATI
jgi:hypothetical protein